MPEQARQERPGYRSDFYIIQNIIGYTGTLQGTPTAANPLKGAPTVYFWDGKEYGHITQQHDVPSNVGRELVCEPMGRWTYLIDNFTREGRTACEEWEVHPEHPPRLVHPSRSPFVDCRRKGINTFAILAQSIWRFPEMKRLARQQLRRGRRFT